ncbi:hypothetical protein EZJ49_01880 [Bdellovibrio bacteriovorus]|uniref:hypothetical protein n=1 Tax=Bdellovibrio bacteriovorus TaxID=959 RepID=UPI0021D044B6|nr:hypothetical protein [Bdellovibrio bacteriovorus]UXR64998.1 hypothetical protein EZJ49_01880 [Bdellovibrio bacteriovorus]
MRLSSRQNGMKIWNMKALMTAMLVSQTVSAAMPQLDLPETGWHEIPQVFQPYLTSKASHLEYNAESKFLRQFRVNRLLSRDSHVVNIEWNKISVRKDAPLEIRQCWGIFVSGGSCGKAIVSPLPTHYSPEGELDLLKYARHVAYYNGLAVSRDVFVNLIRDKDASKGEMRKRIIETTRNTNKTYPNSLATIRKDQRKDIGVYLVLGIGGEKSKNAALIQRAAEELRRMGFTSEMLMVDAELGSDYNAVMLKEMLAQRLPRLKKVVLVAASKGVADFITFFLNHGESLSLREREKVKLMVSLAGVIRPSFVANYVMESKGVIPKFVKTTLTVTGRTETKKGISSLAENPWEGHDPKGIKNLFPNMKWLSMPAVPEGLDGVTHRSLWEGFLKTPSYRYAEEASPMDGLVESAASVLPPDTGLQELIVPIYGPHAMALGYYTANLKVAPNAHRDTVDKVVPEAGAEMLSAIFRALPVSLVD